MPEIFDHMQLHCKPNCDKNAQQLERHASVVGNIWTSNKVYPRGQQRQEAVLMDIGKRYYSHHLYDPLTKIWSDF
jgi:hypothetical protein